MVGMEIHENCLSNIIRWTNFLFDNFLN